MSQLKQLRKSGTTKNLVKKYKVTSQITTRSMSKKNKKTVYCHHDNADNDNSYTKDTMIIERVNDDCLAEIFMYVPACERPNIALVCKQWKRALDDSWFNVKKLELTHWEYDEYPHFLKRNYPTIDGQFKFLKSLLYKCGHYLRELDLSVYPKCNILPIINDYCPNLEKLQIRIDYIDDIDRAIFNNVFTNLSKLKVLKIIFHGCLSGVDSLVPTTLINSLLNVADTLTDLVISNWPEALIVNAHFLEEMTSVTSQLTALRKFVIDGLECHESLCDYVNNSKTIESFCDNNCYRYGKIHKIELFENIEVLDIMCCRITDDGIYNIANTMKQLHTLHISCSWLTDTGIVTCTKMNKLKCLSFYDFNNTIGSSIKLLKNLRELHLPHSNKITDESVIKVLENSPDMRGLIVAYTSVTHKFIEKAAEISRNRKRQLDIWITLEGYKPDTQVKYEYLTVVYKKKRETAK